MPETVEVREAIEKRRSAYENLYELIDECFFQEMVDVNRYANSRDFIEKCYGNAQAEEYIEYKRLLEEGVTGFLGSKKMDKSKVVA